MVLNIFCTQLLTLILGEIQVHEHLLKQLETTTCIKLYTPLAYHLFFDCI